MCTFKGTGVRFMINILVDTNIFTREKLNFLYVDANQSSSTDIDRKISIL